MTADLDRVVFGETVGGVLGDEVGDLEPGETELLTETVGLGRLGLHLLGEIGDRVDRLLLGVAIQSGDLPTGLFLPGPELLGLPQGGAMPRVEVDQGVEVDG